MSGEIWVAIITSGLSFLGVLVTVIWGNKKTAKATQQQTDLTIYRIKQLEEKQDKYNHLQERVAKMEIHDAKVDTKIEDIRGDLKEIKNKLFSEQ